MDSQLVDRFLAELRRTGHLARAIAASGLSKGGLFKCRARDPHFARRWAEALAMHRRQPSVGPRLITRAAERAFLAALLRGATVRQAAAEAGFTHPSFYARARRDPRFAALMADVLAVGEARRLIRFHRMDWTEEELEADRDAFEPSCLPMPRRDFWEAFLQLHHHRKTGKLQQYWERYRAQRVKPLEELQDQIMAKIDAMLLLERWRETGRWLR